MKSDVQTALEQLQLAQGVVRKLTAPGELATVVPTESEERRWLFVASERLQTSGSALRARMERALALPELQSLRLERRQQLEQDWVAAVRQLFEALVREVGQTSPVVESLFPHQRFEKLERGGSTLRAFRSDYEVRRGSAYVRRLEADPEHPRLSGLLAGVDRASAALSELDGATGGPDENADALRADILEAARDLARTLQQARALCEAALVQHPERLQELGFRERPKKRSSRAPDDREVDPS